jgi:nitrogen fixation/metabolism regulation signal transduction histidine kinase
VLPPIVAVEIIAVCIAFGIGLISSRKVAVPLYKIEKWAAKIKTGNLRTKLAFRVEDHLKDLTTQCNAATDFYRGVFLEIRTQLEMISKQPDNQESVIKSTAAIKQTLDKLEL